jgi:hypothetical protein
MKSNHNQPSYQTSCKDCVFSEYEGITQVSCKADRLKFFEDTVEAYDNDKEFYVINDVCTYYRPPFWNNGKADIDEARRELKTTFGIFLDLSGKEDEDLDKTIDSIRRINYSKKSILVTMNHLVLEEKPYYHQVLGSLLNNGFNAFLTVAKDNLSKDWDNVTRLGRTNFFTFVKSGEQIDPDAFSSCDRMKNQDGEKFVSFTSGGTDLLLTNVFLQHYFEYASIPKLTDALLKQSKEEGHHRDLNG